MPPAVTREEETHYTHCFEAHLYCIINSYFTGRSEAPHQLAHLQIGS